MKFSVARIFITLFMLGLFAFVALIVLSIIGEWSFQALWVLLSGWATYPFKILPQVEYNIEMILCGVTALALGTYLAHRFLKWIALHVEALPSPWPFKFTASLSFLLLSMFGTSIAMTGIVHQTAWLVTAEQITRKRSRSITSMQRFDASNLTTILFIQAFKGDDSKFFPNSIKAALEKADGNLDQDAALCRYENDSREPWLYPGKGKLYSGSKFPLIVSPRPNKSGHIIVGYSTMEVESYLTEELPPEVSIFFE